MRDKSLNERVKKVLEEGPEKENDFEFNEGMNASKTEGEWQEGEFSSRFG